MSENPTLFVIAGPNGAGKSTFAPVIVPEGTVIINSDKILSDMEKQYGQSLKFAAANKEIDKLITTALSSRNSICVETNFTDPAEIDRYKSFKDKGYDLALVYVGLNDLDESAYRVNFRVQQGGHSVSEYERELNFKNGLANAIHFSKEFDVVFLVHNPLSKIPIPEIVLEIENNKITYQSENLPEWAKGFKSELLNERKLMPWESEDDNLKEGRGRKR